MVASSKQDRWEVFKTMGTHAKCEEIFYVRAVNLQTEKSGYLFNIKQTLYPKYIICLHNSQQLTCLNKNLRFFIYTKIISEETFGLLWQKVHYFSWLQKSEILSL